MKRSIIAAVISAVMIVGLVSCDNPTPVDPHSTRPPIHNVVEGDYICTLTYYIDGSVATKECDKFR